MLKNKRIRKNTEKQEDIKTSWNVWGTKKKNEDKTTTKHNKTTTE